MLKNISPLISPSLLKVLCEMGEGEEIVFADAYFPVCKAADGGLIVRADGLGMRELLGAVLPIFPLDVDDPEHFLVMQTVGNDPASAIWDDFSGILRQHAPNSRITFIERFAYYERAKRSYAVIATGEVAPYANVILKKGRISET